MGVVDSSSQIVSSVPYSSHSSPASAWVPAPECHPAPVQVPEASKSCQKKFSYMCSSPLLQLPSGHFHLCRHGALLGLQMDICSTMEHLQPMLQGNNLHSHELCQGLQGKLYSSLPLLNWPWCLQSCFPQIYSLLSHSLLLCSALNPFLFVLSLNQYWCHW